MNCIRCKDHIDEDSNFCNKCGMEQNSEIQPMEEDPSQNKKKGWSTKKVIAVIGITLFSIFIVAPFVAGMIAGIQDAAYYEGYEQGGIDSGGYYDDGYNQDLEDFFEQDYDGFWDTP